MYSTCLFCKRPLGTNEVIENFPVGRRLAFDSKLGRLWVLCTHCERWNLSALEERWEAIEECERRFASTRLRVSTENIGLARLPEGLSLIRIGVPQRPEMAAWRYGDRFGRRRKQAMIGAGLGLGLMSAVLVGGAAAGIAITSFGGLLANAANVAINGSPNKVVARIPGPDNMTWKIRRKYLQKIRLIPEYDRSASWRLSIKADKDILEYRGEEAIRVAGVLLPPLNRFGGTTRQVESAVGFLEQSGDPGAAFASAARDKGASYAKLHKLDSPLRLALEMAAHEEAERRALEGELALLESAWREAEEIAAISDTLLIPKTVDDWLARLRGSPTS